MNDYKAVLISWKHLINEYLGLSDVSWFLQTCLVLDILVPWPGYYTLRSYSILWGITEADWVSYTCKGGAGLLFQVLDQNTEDNRYYSCISSILFGASYLTMVTGANQNFRVRFLEVFSILKWKRSLNELQGVWMEPQCIKVINEMIKNQVKTCFGGNNIPVKQTWTKNTPSFC